MQRLIQMTNQKEKPQNKVSNAREKLLELNVLVLEPSILQYHLSLAYS